MNLGHGNVNEFENLTHILLFPKRLSGDGSEKMARYDTEAFFSAFRLSLWYRLSCKASDHSSAALLKSVSQ